MAIPKEQQKNFETLKRAFKNGDVALMEAKDKKTGDIIDVVCAVQRVGDEYAITPLAFMVRENAYERFAPPDPDNAGMFLNPVEH